MAICRVEALPLLIRSEMNVFHWEFPDSMMLKLKILKQFKPYCPKCGHKIDYDSVKKLIKE